MGTNKDLDNNMKDSIRVIIHIIRRVSKLFLLSVALIVIASPVFSETGKLNVQVGVFQNKPLSYQDSSGRFIGVYPDLLEIVAGEENWNIVYVKDSWAGCLERLKNGDIDLMVSIVHTLERERVFDFSSRPVVTSWGQVYTKKDNKINGIFDLSGKIIGVMKSDVNGLNFQKTISKFQIKCDFAYADTYHDLSEMIVEGQVYAGVINNLNGAYLQNQYDIFATPIVFNPVSAVFAAPKGKNHNLLKSLDSYIYRWRDNKDSVYYKILNKYYIGLSPETKRPAKLILTIVIIATAIALLLFLWVSLLRFQVRRRTEALSRSEKRFRMLVEQAGDAIFLVDRTGRIIDVNTQSVNNLGYTRDELLKLQVTDIDSNLSRKELEKFIESLTPGKPVLIESLHRRQDGSVFPVATRVGIIEYDDESLILGLARDISEAKQSEEELRESGERLRRVVENMPVMMDALDENNNIIVWNRECERVTGYSASEMVGNPHSLKLLYPDDEYRERMISELADLEFDFRDKEYNLTCKDGTVKTINWSNVSDRFPIPGWHTWAVGVDVTKLRQAENNLKIALEEAQLSQKEISALLKASQAIPLSKTFEEAAREIFDICKEVLGAKAGYVALLSEDGEENEVLFLEAGGLACNVNPELPMPIRGLRESAYRTKEVVYDNNFADSQWKKYLPPGHVKLNNVLFAPLNIDDKAVGLIGIANKSGGFTERDAIIAKAFGELGSVALTYAQYQDQLRESEKRYRTVADNTFDWEFWLDPDGKFVYCSPSCERITGYSPSFFESNANQMMDIVHPHDRQIFQYHLDEEARKGRPGKLEFRIIDKEGKTRWIEHVCHQVLEGDVNYGTRGGNREITERKLAEKEKKKLQSHLQQAQKMEALGTLAGGIAHDFNNILAAMTGYTELSLHSLPDDSEENQYLSEVLKAGLRAKGLVNQILAFSRPSEENRKPIEIQPIIKESIRFLRASIPTYIELVHDIIPEPVAVYADPTQINQIIINLCTNAAHAIGDKSGNIKVSLALLEKDEKRTDDDDGSKRPNYVILSVNDTGSGMDRETINKIFDPFYTTKSREEGTGLGLSVVHGIVKSMDGEIKVQSTPGLGSTFELLLPILLHTATKEAPRIESLEKGMESILVIDDEKILGDMLEKMLIKLGYYVISQTSPIEALELIKKNPHRFDLVITDQNMPNITGTQLGEEIMKINPALPIILCTGFSEQIDKERAEAIGFNQFLMKPVIFRDLAKAVRQAMESI